MKKNLAMAAVFLLCFSSGSIAGQFGPAQPGMKQGQFSLGPGFFGYKGELDGDAKSSQMQAYAQAGLGITDNLEIYGQIGAADLTVEKVFDGSDFEDGFRPFGAVGFRALLTDRKPIGMGIFAQGSYFDTFEDKGTFRGAAGTTVEFDQSFELSGGIALQTMIEGALLYGGPFFYTREGDVKISGVGTSSVEEQGNFGGFLGIRWPLLEGVNFELEGQVKTKASLGGSIQFIF